MPEKRPNRNLSDPEVQALVRQVSEYTGDPSQAQSMQECASQFSNITGRPSKSAEQAVQKAATFARGKSVDGAFGIRSYSTSGQGALSDEDKQLAAYLAPFLGMEVKGAASYHDPLKIDDQSSIAWANYIASHPVAPDERMDVFIDTLFRVRPRNLWLPAAEALAALAFRGDEISEYCLLELCHKHDYDPMTVGHVSAKQKSVTMDDDNRHLGRHLRYAAACWLAGGGSAQKLPSHMQALPTSDLPQDSTAASIELCCLAARLRAVADRSAFVPLLARYLEPARQKMDKVVEEALRFLFESLAPAVAGDPSLKTGCEALEKALLNPLWLNARQTVTVDLMLSWLQSIDLASKHQTDPTRRLATQHPLLALLLNIRFSPESVAAPADLLTARLKDIFTPARLAAKSRFQRVLCIVEALALIEHPDISSRDSSGNWCGLDWAALLQAGQVPELPVALITGPAGQAAVTDLICWLAKLCVDTPENGLLTGARPQWFGRKDFSDYVPLQAIRHHTADEQTVVALTQAHHQGVTNQVAVQAERILRAYHGKPDAQIRFLWRLLEKDPLDEVFKEIKSDLRKGGRQNSLVDILKALERMDQSRTNSGEMNCTERMKRYLEEYELLVVAVQNHLNCFADSTPGVLQERFTTNLNHMRRIKTDLETSNSGRARIARLVQGLEDVSISLSDWFAWVDDDKRREALSHSGRQLKQAIAALPVSISRLTPELLATATSQHKTMLAELVDAPWPEREGLCCVLEEIGHWLNRLNLDLEEQDALATKVEKWLEDKNIAALNNALQADDENDAFPNIAGQSIEKQKVRLSILPTATLSRLNDFWQERLDFKRARKLRCILDRQYDAQMKEQSKEAQPTVIPKSERIRLVSKIGYLSPLMVGIPVGTLLVLDFGSVWNEVIDKNWQLWSVVAVSLLLSFMTLLGSLIRRTAEDMRDSGATLWYFNMIRRAFGGVFIWIWLGAIVTSFLIVLSLMGTEATENISTMAEVPLFVELLFNPEYLWPLIKQVLLWSGLSLFLGIFLGLIAQGRGLYIRRRPLPGEPS